jgi:hypothetical protein
VRIEGGRPTVEWEYRSASFRRGLAAALATLLAAGLLLFLFCPRRGDGIRVVWRAVSGGGTE